MMKERLDHFIAGRFRPPASGRYLEDHDPVTGRKIADVARGDASDVDAAVAAANEALPAWRDRRPIERGRILTEIARKIRSRMAELCAIERAETGKPAFQAPIEIEVAAQYFELYGGLVNATPGEAIDLGAGYHSYTRREPFGVVGVILPWNAPLNQAGRGIAPALAAGNTVVAKPSEFTSGSLLELGSPSRSAACRRVSSTWLPARVPRPEQPWFHTVTSARWRSPAPCVPGGRSARSPPSASSR